MTYGITPANDRCRAKRTALSVAMPSGYHRPQDVLMELGKMSAGSLYKIVQKVIPNNKSLHEPC